MAKKQECILRLHGSRREFLTSKFESITAAKKWVNLCWNRPYTLVKLDRINKRLEQLRKEILAEKISYSEIAELQNLAPFIDKNDVLLLQWAGVEEK